MNLCRLAVIVIVGIIAGSCSENTEPARESKVTEDKELQPHEEEIAQDCVAFVRSTKAVPAQTPAADCPGCPAPGADVLMFQRMQMERISCAGDSCAVLVTLAVTFNPGAGERMTGGLTAWIPPEERSAYLSGRTPSGEQSYRVQITYKLRGNKWRAVEFDRAPGQ